MTIAQLDKLVASKFIRSYTFDVRNTGGDNPYMRLELVFPDGTKLVVTPEGTDSSGTERIGLQF